MIKGLIFDLDGTLLDTIEDIAVSLNKALLELGLTSHGIEECKVLIGSGIHDLAREVLPPQMHDPEAIENFITRFREHYSSAWHVNTRVFDGISELLSELRARGLHLAILSNKSQRFTGIMAEHWFNAGGTQIFDPVWGERSGIPVKPDPNSALDIAAAWGLQPDEIAFVGDSDIDMQTAVNAGMMAVGVAWGFREVEELLATGADAILNVPADMLQYL